MVRAVRHLENTAPLAATAAATAATTAAVHGAPKR
jgi:hypothetical protein